MQERGHIFVGILAYVGAPASGSRAMTFAA